MAGVSPRRIGRRAAAAATSLREEYRAGRRGEDGPVTPLWAGPREQLDAVVALLRQARHDAGAGPTPIGDVGRPAGPGAVADPAAPGPTVDPAADLVEARAMADAVSGVDWEAVRAALAEPAADPAGAGAGVGARSPSEAMRTVRAMADQVDWARVQPVASQLARALIAAVAAGHLPVGGRAGGVVAKAIVDQRGFGGLVAQQLQRAGVAVPDLPVPAGDRSADGAARRRAIEATGREAADDGRS